VNKLSFTSVTLDVLPEVARDIISELGSKKVVLFYGEMGSGKTTLIKEICRQLGVKRNMSSPTFGLVNEYAIPSGKIYHFDLYRVKNLEECLDMGMEEYLYSGNYCFIEWPDVAIEIMPDDIGRIDLITEADRRNITVEI
jgi:tRNA threonylcarbamoyladenosine biosynthesis protein TsaE